MFAYNETVNNFGGATMALPLAPNEQNKKFVQDGIEKLKKNQDIN